jgi:hypothetical protein
LDLEALLNLVRGFVGRRRVSIGKLKLVVLSLQQTIRLLELLKHLRSHVLLRLLLLVLHAIVKRLADLLRNHVDLRLVLVH